MADVFDFYVKDNRTIQFKFTEPIMLEDSHVTDWVFHIPRILNNIDMSGWAWWLVYINARGQKYSELLELSEDPESPLEKCIATYSVDYGMSIRAGVVRFSLEAINADTQGTIMNEWHTQTYQAKVQDTLQGNQVEFAETESDIISALIVEVQNKVAQLVGGATPLPVNLKSLMTDHDKVYLYTGSEPNESTGYWYYWNGTDFVPGGQYGAGITDAVPTQGSTNAVSSGGVYDEITSLKADLNNIVESNIVYNISSIVVSGTGKYVSKDILTVDNLSAGDSYGLIVGGVTGNLNGNVAIIYTYEGTTRKRAISANDVGVAKVVTLEGTENKITFRLYPSQGNGATTAIYTDVFIIEGDTLQSRINPSLIPSNETAEYISDVVANSQSITPRSTTFFHVSKNMIDPSALVSGEFVNQANGAFQSYSGYTRTGYIEVEPNTTYVVRNQAKAVSANFRYAFYNASKTYISGGIGSISDMLLTSPANAKYIAMSDTNTNNAFMLATYEDNDKSYEPFDNVHVLNKYIKPDMDDVLLTIPSKVYALVGYELNIYFENITEEWEKYKWDITCSNGMQLERGYRITPVAGDVGTYTLTIKASLSDTISKEVTTTLVVTSASAGASATKSVIVLGDSTTNNGIAITKLNENFSTDAMNISTLGTRGTAPNNHEGRSGWKLSDYFTVEYIDYTDGRGHVENPFYNPTTQTFDADYYFANSGIAKPDWFIINMGINDVFGYEVGTALDSAIETCIGYVDSMVTSVKSASPSSKIGVCLTIPPNHSQDAFGKAYSNRQTRYRYKKNNTIWVNRLIDEYDNRESEGIYLIPIHTNLDTVYNMGMETLPVNARNTTITYQSPIGNGGVHPVESGYWQIADVYTAFFKAHAED